MKTDGGWWGTSYFITCYLIFGLLVAVESVWGVMGKQALKQLFRMATALPLFVLFVYICVDLYQFPWWDPNTFPYPYWPNGTSREEEWRQTLAFPFWLQCLVLLSPLPLVGVGAFTLYDVGKHIVTQDQHPVVRRALSMAVQQRNPFSAWLIRWTGSETADHIFFLRITPLVFALLSYSSILRLMELFTGEYMIQASPNFANETLEEIEEFFRYTTEGNSDCLAFASAMALLHFSAYLLQDLDLQVNQDGMRELISGVVVQMLKYYMYISLLQMSTLIFFFFVFKYEHTSEDLGISHKWASRMIDEFHHYHPVVNVALCSAGTLASMSAWGALNLVTHLCRHQEQITLPVIEMQFHRRFLSIKVMLSVSFLQQTFVFIVGTVMGCPRMTTALAAECLKVYEAPLLAWILQHAWCGAGRRNVPLLA